MKTKKEYMWKEKGRIPQEVWDYWEQGIISNLKIEQVRRVFNEEMNQDNSRNSYYGFPEYIVKKLND